MQAILEAAIVDHDSAQLAGNLVGIPVIIRSGSEVYRCLLCSPTLLKLTFLKLTNFRASSEVQPDWLWRRKRSTKPRTKDHRIVGQSVVYTVEGLGSRGGDSGPRSRAAGGKPRGHPCHHSRWLRGLPFRYFV